MNKNSFFLFCGICICTLMIACSDEVPPIEKKLQLPFSQSSSQSDDGIVCTGEQVPSIDGTGCVDCPSTHHALSDNSACESNQRNCPEALTLSGNIVFGIQQWSGEKDGSWGKCEVRNCKLGYYLDHNSCLPNPTRSSSSPTTPSSSPASCGVDQYLANPTDASCTFVGVGYYSTRGSTDRDGCTNRPSHSGYTSSG